MKHIFLVGLLSFLVVGCGGAKHGISNVKEGDNLGAVNKKAVEVVENALKFEGTPYQYGGTTKRGMDCSGLMYVAFQEENIVLPRTSRAMSLEGKRLKLKEVRAGDLLFFQTNKDRNVINHVGLVVEVSGSEISFIHSSTSRGVIISTLNQPYWNDAFMMARRVL